MGRTGLRSLLSSLFEQRHRSTVALIGGSAVQRQRAVALRARLATSIAYERPTYPRIRAPLKRLVGTPLLPQPYALLTVAPQTVLWATATRSHTPVRLA